MSEMAKAIGIVLVNKQRFGFPFNKKCPCAFGKIEKLECTILDRKMMFLLNNSKLDRQKLNWTLLPVATGLLFKKAFCLSASENSTLVCVWTQCECIIIHCYTSSLLSFLFCTTGKLSHYYHLIHSFLVVVSFLIIEKLPSFSAGT